MHKITLREHFIRINLIISYIQPKYFVKRATETYELARVLANSII